jgi:hypothetical protein
MAISLGRREFLGAVGGATAWPLAARSRGDRVRRIGVLIERCETHYVSKGGALPHDSGGPEFTQNDGDRLAQARKRSLGDVRIASTACCTSHK